MNLTPPQTLPTQPVLGTGLTSIPPPLLPSSTPLYLSPSTSSVQSSFASLSTTPSLTNQIPLSGHVTSRLALPSSMSPAQGISPLAMVGPAHPVSPLTPGQLSGISPALRPIQVLPPSQQPISMLPSSASKQLIFAPPAPPAPLHVMQTQPPMAHTYSAVQLQPVQQHMMQQPTLVQMAAPLGFPPSLPPSLASYPSSFGVPILLQSPPQQYQVAPSSQILMSPQPPPMIIPGPPVAPLPQTGAVIVQRGGLSYRSYMQ